jgi:hypothetical protein
MEIFVVEGGEKTKPIKANFGCRADGRLEYSGQN